MEKRKNRAVFLDRDGVLIEDVNLLINPKDIHILSGVPEALQKLKDAGYLLIVISNQAAVSRGLLSENSVKKLHEEVNKRLIKVGAPSLDGFYFCPHHPKATILKYRVKCECRKPRPGLLLRAANELNIELEKSIMVGDRLTDVIAGVRAGCRTVLLQSGAHLEPIIEVSDVIEISTKPDYQCKNMIEMTKWILDQICEL